MKPMKKGAAMEEFWSGKLVMFVALASFWAGLLFDGDALAWVSVVLMLGAAYYCSAAYGITRRFLFDEVERSKRL
jgi:hypothetical protein